MKFARRLARSKAEAAGLAPEAAATEFVAFTRCFHGRTFGALSLTANPKYKTPFLPLMDGVSYAEYGDLESAAKVIKVSHSTASGTSSRKAEISGCLDSNARTCGNPAAVLPPKPSDRGVHV